ncbi:IS200/IS605 family transposase [Siminovitchia fordii]|uniref:Transposase IS200-like domain-containing protein n=1 Tax=Siminovitchia fordii TaxID=254759 RepID=A0ABQ4K5T2_9BACI|nr:IS200/IS605 family transposase [Siminovitchia fordii]GIN20537.1 hypothetical protein J1TS3_16710 [Siminovitchia fordii]
MSSDVNSLAHTKWNCKYHIVFAPKYRRQIIYGKLKQDIGQILRQLCERKGVEIIEATACKDHIHMLVSIPPKISVSSFVGYLKGKSSLMFPNEESLERFLVTQFAEYNQRFATRCHIGFNQPRAALESMFEQLHEMKE